MASSQEEKSPDNYLFRGRDSIGSIETPLISLEDFCGHTKIKNLIKAKACLFNRELLSSITQNSLPFNGLLIHGPTGSGKTMLGKVISNHLKIPVLIVESMELYADATNQVKGFTYKLYKQLISAPSVLLLENLDHIASKQTRPLNLHFLLDFIKRLVRTNSKILVIGTTRDLKNLHPEVHSLNVFANCVGLGIPDMKTRKEILTNLTRNLDNSESLNIDEISQLTPGFTGGDLVLLVQEATMCNLKGNVSLLQSETELENVQLENGDFSRAVTVVQPKVKTNIFIRIPTCTWKEVISVYNSKKNLEIALAGLFKHLTPKDYKLKGTLMFGPTGCGKSLMANAIANKAGINLLTIKGSDFKNVDIEECSKILRLAFESARNSTPCIIFLDQIEEIAQHESNNSMVQNLQYCLLDELKKGGHNENLYILGATNRPDKTNSRILKIFSSFVYVRLPSPEEREAIMKTFLKDVPPRASDVNLLTIAKSELCKNFSGGDLHRFVKELEFLQTVEETTGRSHENVITQEHVRKAFEKIKRSAPQDMIEANENFKTSWFRTR